MAELECQRWYKRLPKVDQVEIASDPTYADLSVHGTTQQCIQTQMFHACFLRATAGTAIARLSHRNSVRLSVRHTGGSGKNGAS